jgi:hypothetical protein
VRSNPRRRGVMAGLVASSLALAGAAAGGMHVGAADALTFATVNGTVNAGADRVQGGSDAFPNFRNGAFNNFYPLAHAHVDGSPSSEATATPADTGPFGQSLASGTFGSPPFQQPQYANAHFPPGTTQPVTFGSPGGLYAQATAAESSAAAFAEFSSTASGSSASSAASASRRASLLELDGLITAWRQEWLTAADAARYPAVHPNATTPDGANGGTAHSNAVIDPAKGLLLSGTAHAQSSSFGGGMILIGDVDVAVTSSNAGSPAHQVTINVGSASIGGVPVTIDHNGVSVNRSELPGVGLAVDQANAALNQALAQSGYQVRTLAPAITRSPNQEAVDATGVEVQYTQPAVAPGVPRQEVIHDIGDVSVDSLAAPGTPTALNVSGPIVTSPPIAGTPGSSEFVPGTPGTPGVPGTTGASTSPTSPPAQTASPPLRAIVRRSKPVDLVLLYFLWQSLVIGTVASLWWRRLEQEPVA